jgi:hypothetical protein
MVNRMIIILNYLTTVEEIKLLKKGIDEHCMCIKGQIHLSTPFPLTNSHAIHVIEQSKDRIF